MFHPEDQDKAWEKWRHSLATGEPYEIEYRLRDRNGDYRWTLGRALPVRGEDGAILRWFGTCTDIHDTRMALQQRELVSQELSHRIKNIFAVIDGLISFSARHHPEMKAGAADLRDRIHALGHAHDFVRPRRDGDAGARRSGLHAFLRELLAAYAGAGGERIVIAGDDLPINEHAATPLALLFHELATNAVKYGALKSAAGTVTLTARAGAERLALEWRETGGPPVSSPGPDGFGSKLVELSVVRQLRGTVERDWRAEGLVVTVAIPMTALA
jgi:two-component sensor histidine kinase